MFLFPVTRKDNPILFYPVVIIRAILLTLWFFISCFLGLIMCTYQFKSPDIPRQVCQFYSPVSAYIAGVHVKFIDYDKYMPASGEPNAVYVSNHQSLLDLSFFGNKLPKRTVCVAKHTLKYVPLFGLFWMASGNVFIERFVRDKAISKLKGATQRLRDKECSIWIFPEGTRNHKDSSVLLPFKKGAFHIAVQAQTPIVPVVTSDQSVLFDPKNGHWRGGEIRVRALPPIPTKGLTTDDVNDLLEKTQNMMQKALDEINNKKRN